ncbi:mitochondrial carrier domain-containing protein [Schizophyllum commune]
MSAPTSLRDLYIDGGAAWAFQPQNGTNAPAPPVSSVPPPPPAPWTHRAAHNSIFDLSPSLDLSEPTGINATDLFKALVASAVLQYTSTAIAMPWEVGKLLLQVQWVPRDAGELENVPQLEEEEEESSELSDENDEESYFADPNSAHPGRHHAPVHDEGSPPRHGVLQDGRPEYIIPVGSADGVWGMIKRVGRFRLEGWLSLWKGLLTSCASEVVSSTLQPVIHSMLQALFAPSLSPFHQQPLILPITSHLLTGFLLSPLDLVRTRLIVQSASPHYRSYTGPIDALSQILREEGGWHSIYFHPQLLIPTLIDCTLRPLVSLAMPGLLVRYVGARISQDSHPVAWGAAELAGSCLGLLVTLPFETIRRRLQVQVRGTARPIRGCVELRPQPYAGVVDTFWHILTEERSDLPLPVSRQNRRRSSLKGKEREVVEEDSEEKDHWTKHTGLGQLYRGLGMRLGASAIVFVLALLSGDDGGDSGWAEL